MPALPNASISRQLRLAESSLFAGALQFDEFARGIHYQVEVHRGGGIFRVAKVQQRLLPDDADAHRRDGVPDWIGRQPAFGQQLADGQGQRDVGAGDRRRARAAVGLQDVAVHPDGAGAQLLQVEGRAHRPADQALDLLRATVDLALGDVALFALQGGVGEHRVLGRDPAAGDALLLHPARHGILDRDAANDARVAPFDQGRAGGVGRDVVLEAHGADLAGRAAIGAGGGSDRG